MYKKKVREKEKTHVLSSISFFFPENHVVYEMWKGHRWQYGTCALHAGYLRLQTHTHNM
jgi:hypothetical protein